MSIVSQILANPESYSVQQLQQAMESGVVPGYVAIPLIQDKMQQQQRMQMAMQGEGAPEEGGPTVAEEVMQQAAQSQGIEALPSGLPTEEQSYAPGGIVAFETGGHVPRYRVGGLKLRDDDEYGLGIEEMFGPDYEQAQKGIASLMPYAEVPEPEPESDMVNRVRRNLALMKELQGEAPSTKEALTKARELLAQRSAQSAADAQTLRERNIVNLLANVAASRDPYSSVAIGSGVAKSLPEFTAAEAAQRKQEMEDAMAGLSLTKAEREEALAGLPSAIQLTGYETEEDVKKAAARASVARERIKADRERYGGFDIQAMNARANRLAYSKFKKPLNELNPEDKAEVLGLAAEAQQNAKLAPQLAALGLRGDIALLNNMQETEKLIADTKTKDKNLVRAYRDMAVLEALPKPTEAQQNLLNQYKKQIGEFEEWADNARARALSGMKMTPWKGLAAAPAPAPAKVEPKVNVAPASKVSATTKPTLEQFLEEAKKSPKNAGISDKDLIAYYKKTYGQ